MLLPSLWEIFGDMDHTRVSMGFLLLYTFKFSLLIEGYDQDVMTGIIGKLDPYSNQASLI